MRNIFVLSRNIMNQWIIDKNRPNTLFGDWALISISGSFDVPYNGALITSDSIPILNHIGCTKMLSLNFADIDSENFDTFKIKHQNANKEIDLFNSSHAHQILDFIKTLDESTLIIHCAAGISRSGAVGLFCCRYFDLDQKEFRRLNRQIYPNSHVLDVLNKESGIKNDYIKFWENTFFRNDVTKRIKFI